MEWPVIGWVRGFYTQPAVHTLTSCSIPTLFLSLGDGELHTSTSILRQHHFLFLILSRGQIRTFRNHNTNSNCYITEGQKLGGVGLLSAWNVSWCDTNLNWAASVPELLKDKFQEHTSNIPHISFWCLLVSINFNHHLSSSILALCPSSTRWCSGEHVCGCQQYCSWWFRF